MGKIYTFCIDAIAQGRTVLVYRGVTSKTAKHVKTVERLAMVGDVLYCDGVSCKGMTVALKPEKWNG